MFDFTVTEVFTLCCNHRRSIQSPFTVARDESVFHKALQAKLGHLKIEVLVEKQTAVHDWIDETHLPKSDIRHLSRLIRLCINHWEFMQGGDTPTYRTRKIYLGKWAYIQEIPNLNKKEEATHVGFSNEVAQTQTQA